MNPEVLDRFRHEHDFLGEHHARNERRTWTVIAVCGTMMTLEIAGGLFFGSMALLADGLHMSTHSGALLIAALAYSYARRHAHDGKFTFGTGKLGDLAGFTSAIVLAMIALLIACESVDRFFHPIHIAFDEAIPLAILGLLVNLLSAWLLHEDHDHHGHGHHNPHDHDHHHHHHHHHHHSARDMNLRAAYVHVLADAAVSVLAIIGLMAGRELGWVWMDPVMGVVGALVIANWSWGLIRLAGAVLLDRGSDRGLSQSIVERLEAHGDHVVDLHILRVGPGHNAAVVTLVSDAPQAPAFYKEKLRDVGGISHLTIEVEPYPA